MAADWVSTSRSPSAVVETALQRKSQERPKRPSECLNSKRNRADNKFDKVYDDQRLIQALMHRSIELGRRRRYVELGELF